MRKITLSLLATAAAVTTMAVPGPARAQLSQAQLQALITTNIPSGNPNVLTAASLRAVLDEIVLSQVVSAAACPTSNLTPGQLFLDTAFAPAGALLQVYDGTECVPIGTLNQSSHTFSGVGASANILAFGADPTGSADSTAAFNAAAAASSSVTVPPGKYKFDSQLLVTVSDTFGSFKLECAGPDNTILYWPSSTPADAGLVVKLPGAVVQDQSVHVHDCGFTTSAASNSTVGLTVEATGAIAGGAAPSDLVNVTFRGDNGYGGSESWGIGTALEGVSNVDCVNCVFWGDGSSPSGVGLYVVGPSSCSPSPCYATVINVVNSTFNFLSAGFDYGTYVQGVNIAGSNFTGNLNGIYVGPSLNGLAQLTVTGNQFGIFNADAYGIITQTPVEPTQIVNNLFIVGAGATASTSIFLDTAADYNIQANQMNGDAVMNSNGIIVEGQTSGTVGVISGNVVRNYPGSCIGLDTGAYAATVTNNQLVGCGTPINNVAGANVISQNVGGNGQTYARLPSCGATYQGVTQFVTDANTNTWGAIVSSGGGSDPVAVQCNGSNWTVVGK